MLNHYNNGVDAFNEGKYAEAAYWMGKCLEANPANASGYAVMGKICSKHNEYGFSAIMYENAFRLGTDDDYWEMVHHLNYAEVLSKLERHEEALVIFERYQKQRPDDKDIAKAITREQSALTFVKAAREAVAAQGKSHA